MWFAIRTGTSTNRPSARNAQSCTAKALPMLRTATLANLLEIGGRKRPVGVPGATAREFTVGLVACAGSRSRARFNSSSATLASKLALALDPSTAWIRIRPPPRQ